MLLDKKFMKAKQSIRAEFPTKECTNKQCIKRSKKQKYVHKQSKMESQRNDFAHLKAKQMSKVIMNKHAV